ncbi:uncharacterized protein B0I36DRAFT_338889 [Microdochium trichocladiopsis]|uniref:Uncharacterized protein n=1 Tax=Microdochium trichocladiopsis TaxID=1682393 RepID=A0A9P8XSF2_9PEZI|nr:uncharacterized protein B0I36DRAFT_338889 [Microdochium trichocladiopsis]KAH7014558.1 hypothetical protein B0I36DRAFT_338889 [Microdochium trichocladiopsis]
MADQQEDQPPYPSWEELYNRHDQAPGSTVEEFLARPPIPRFAPHTWRLFWHFRGDFPECVSVARVKWVEEDVEPFFTPAEEGQQGDDPSVPDGDAGGGTWHEIAHLPLTEPKVSSINASSLDLEMLECNWVWTHREFHDDNCESDDGGWVRYGDLGSNSAVDPSIWETGAPDYICTDDTKCLIRCSCGEDRPVGKSELKITEVPSPGNDFVTVKDYISTVHPWLMSMRDDIWKAKKVERATAEPDAASLEWMVVYGPQHETMLKSWYVRPRRSKGTRTICVTVAGTTESVPG